MIFPSRKKVCKCMLDTQANKNCYIFIIKFYYNNLNYNFRNNRDYVIRKIFFFEFNAINNKKK